MKKLYYIAAFAAIGLASCSDVQDVITPQAPQEIRFDAVAGKPTRAAIDAAKFGEGAVIYVAAAHQSESTADYANIFGDKETVAFTNSNGTFNSPENEKYYYPTGGRLGFVAYYTGKEGGDFVAPNNAGSIIERNGTQHHFSKLTLDYTTTNKLVGATDVMYGNGSTTSLSGTTKLIFNHALAWITVGINETTNSIRVTDLYLKDVVLTGKMSVEVTDDHKFQNLAWDLTGMDKSSPSFARYKSTTGVNPTESGEDAVGVLLPIQTQKSLVLKYFLADDATKKEVVKEIALNTDPTAIWEAGKHYTYILNFNVNEISFTCDITNYGTSTVDTSAK